MDKVVGITGASGTLGTAITEGLAAQGAKVYMLDRNVEKAEKLARGFRDSGHSVHVVASDVLDQSKMENAFQQVVDREGHIDVLINGAGGNMTGATIGPDQSVFDLNIDAFRKVMDLNLMGTVTPTIAALRHMVKRNKGCIINISSMSAILPLTRVVGYSASKASVDNFTRSMAIEVTQKYGEGIRINAIAPGFLVAEQNRKLLLNEDGSLTDRGKTIISQTPIGRFGKPEELLSTIEWLCDDRSTLITGIIVPIDGGFSAFSGV